MSQWVICSWVSLLPLSPQKLMVLDYSQVLPIWRLLLWKLISSFPGQMPTCEVCVLDQMLWRMPVISALGGWGRITSLRPAWVLPCFLQASTEASKPTRTNSESRGWSIMFTQKHQPVVQCRVLFFTVQPPSSHVSSSVFALRLCVLQLSNDHGHHYWGQCLHYFKLFFPSNYSIFYLREL